MISSYFTLYFNNIKKNRKWNVIAITLYDNIKLCSQKIKELIIEIRVLNINIFIQNENELIVYLVINTFFHRKTKSKGTVINNNNFTERSENPMKL